MRLTQFLSQAGVCSRRAASRLILDGRVQLNQVTATPHCRFEGHESVTVDGNKIVLAEQPLYVLYHKPVGVDCNCRPDDPASIMNQLNLPQRLFPVGRIDKDSRGLMLLTNDGELCHRLLSPCYQHSKEYVVEVRPHSPNSVLNESFKQQMETGVQLEDRLTLPCEVTLLSSYRFKIRLTQGLNRQIRRMCRALGFHVIDLQRTRILFLTLDGLEEQQWRHLSPVEIKNLQSELVSSLNV